MTTLATNEILCGSCVLTLIKSPFAASASMDPIHPALLKRMIDAQVTMKPKPPRPPYIQAAIESAMTRVPAPDTSDKNTEYVNALFTTIAESGAVPLMVEGPVVAKPPPKPLIKNPSPYPETLPLCEIPSVVREGIQFFTRKNDGTCITGIRHGSFESLSSRNFFIDPADSTFQGTPLDELRAKLGEITHNACLFFTECLRVPEKDIVVRIVGEFGTTGTVKARRKFNAGIAEGEFTVFGASLDIPMEFKESACAILKARGFWIAPTKAHPRSPFLSDFTDIEFLANRVLFDQLVAWGAKVVDNVGPFPTADISAAILRAEKGAASDPCDIAAATIVTWLTDYEGTVITSQLGIAKLKHRDVSSQRLPTGYEWDALPLWQTIIRRYSIVEGASDISAQEIRMEPVHPTLLKRMVEAHISGKQKPHRPLYVQAAIDSAMTKIPTPTNPDQHTEYINALVAEVIASHDIPINSGGPAASGPDPVPVCKGPAAGSEALAASGPAAGSEALAASWPDPACKGSASKAS